MKSTNGSLALETVVLLWVLGLGCASVPTPLGSTNDARRESVGMSSGTFSPSIEELNRYVLVLQESHSGQVTHSWHPVAEFDLSQFRILPRAQRTYGRIVLAAARQRDCDAELLACVEECMSTPLPRGFGHITAPGRGMGAKEVYCNKKCRQAYMDCSELQERRPQEFSTTVQAIDWLKRNRNEVLVGSLVVVAGVVFIVAFPPGALLALIPATALASSDAIVEPYAVAVVP